MPSLRSGKSTPTLTDRTLSPSPDQFPRPAGQSLSVSKRDNGIISPTKPTFTFLDEDPADQDATPDSDLFDEKRITRHMKRDPPGTRSVMSLSNRSREEVESSERKSKFYGEVFAYREPHLSARDRISGDSIVTAELKTNVIIKDEYTLLTTLSTHLSARYARPPTSILIHLAHSACLLLASSFDPAYHLTITALPSLLQPTTNKRNAALIQSFMAEAIGVEAGRGVLRFVAVREEDLATGGMTVAGEIEGLAAQGHKNEQRESVDGERGGGQGRGGGKREARSRSRRGEKAEEKGRSLTREQDVMEKAGGGGQEKVPPVPPVPGEKSVWDRRAEKVQKVGRRRSFLAMFGR
ncbi:MAG: hypothetical protein FRX48_09644 [Lasallia pustulata]|uniref:L-dopachrome isomerase n=1 Tax=Lasallia pustulata TaxID=136370 RepID=A0A5M8PBB2_9LECA|nr:MAG: hypothetical protein FRX48_09644 [Lasallia pustulata]